MRLIDADELIEHAWRDKLDSRELIAQMISTAPTIKEIPTNIPIHIFERLLELAEREQEPCEDYISRQDAIKAACEGADAWYGGCSPSRNEYIENAIKDIVPVTPHITPGVLADALMEERIRGKLDSDTIFEKDIIRDVKCRLTVSIRDRRPCYCGAELREVWRESEDGR